MRLILNPLEDGSKLARFNSCVPSQELSFPLPIRCDQYPLSARLGVFQCHFPRNTYPFNDLSGQVVGSVFGLCSVWPLGSLGCVLKVGYLSLSQYLYLCRYVSWKFQSLITFHDTPLHCTSTQMITTLCL
jgi:hypothetical protein